MDYSIKAYPTKFRGVQYRSRLEARWAAFFTLLNFDFVYEPFDLGAWSPDFLLKGKYGFEVLVEVKPITEIDAETTRKMFDAAKEQRLLLVGVSPKVSSVGLNGFLQVGWWIEGESENAPALVGGVFDDNSPAVVWDFLKAEAPIDFFMGWLTATVGSWPLSPGGRPEAACPYREHVLGLWKSACNLVQWVPAGRP